MIHFDSNNNRTRFAVNYYHRDGVAATSVKLVLGTQAIDMTTAACVNYGDHLNNILPANMCTYHVDVATETIAENCESYHFLAVAGGQTYSLPGSAQFGIRRFTTYGVGSCTQGWSGLSTLSTQSTQSGSYTLNGGDIAGIVIAVVLAVALLCVIIALAIWQINQNKSSGGNTSTAGQDNFRSQALG